MKNLDLVLSAFQSETSSLRSAQKEIPGNWFEVGDSSFSTGSYRHRVHDFLWADKVGTVEAGFRILTAICQEAPDRQIASEFS